MQSAPARRIGDWCGACGARLLDPGAETCPRCEAAVPTAGARPRKGRITAAVIAFLFGGLGAHRFYLGESGLGTAYLLTSWTLVPSVLALVDFVRLIATTDAAFEARYAHARGGGLAPAALATAVGLVAWAALAAVVTPKLLALAETLAAMPR